ncbi:DUF1775 domain-containing protein [Micromonospora siamensis]|uniref:Domain of unkown function n=1 Tax=Micromonospora siamensis TaxID=299152 RepID=A0A1C5I1Y6_9ACTN|nr:DUF1775 domain-containing protein [Micromonospora siamensis]SCG52254.1 Domain of unkown function [Micromonospora siamensis]
MTMTRRVRTALLLTAVATGTLGWPGTASAAGPGAGISGLPRGAAAAVPGAAAGATVTTTPAQVHQGDAVEVAVLLPEERAGSRTTRIELRMPPDAPIGEVYPLSVPDWAPRITTRTLDRPVAGIHSPELDRVTEAVTWTRAPGAGTAPARLSLGMGPMPATDRVTFQLIQTYADGTVIRWTDPAGGAHPAPTIPLLPALPVSGGHAGHGGTDAAGPVQQPGSASGSEPGPATGAGQAPGSDQAPGAYAGSDGARAAGPASTAASTDGPSADLLLGGGLLAGLGGGAAIGWLVSRRRHHVLALPPDTPDAHSDPDRDLIPARPSSAPAEAR